jgi:hypothetical protein
MGFQGKIGICYRMEMRGRYVLRLGCVIAVFGVAGPGFCTDLTGGLIVSRLGDGSTALTTASAAIFLDKYSTAGVKDASNTVALPTVTGNGMNRITTSGAGANIVGLLGLSTNNQFLMVAGYDAAPGTTGIAATTSAAVNRVVGRISLDGFVDTTTKLTDAFSGGTGFRMVASNDGYHFWMTGDSSTSGGVRYANIGDSTSTQLVGTPTNMKGINIYNGQLYTTTSISPNAGVNSTGTGLPTTAGQSNSLFATTTSIDPYDFLFWDPNTLYVADTRNTSAGGLLKFKQSAGVWSLNETINYVNGLGAPIGLRSLTTDGTRIFAITNDGTSKILSILDGEASNQVDVIASADTNTIFRGIRWVPNQPVPEPFSMIALGAGFVGFLARRKKS